MNEIEQKFYEAFNKLETMFGIEEQVVIGIYKVDFVVGDCVIEIDGHEYHKTKEQREHDYKRERYLLMKGYHPVRFTGTEVFLEPDRCAKEANDIAEYFEMKIVRRDMKASDVSELVGKISEVDTTLRNLKAFISSVENYKTDLVTRKKEAVDELRKFCAGE